MSTATRKTRTPLVRIFADDNGEVFLRLESGAWVKVEKPIREHLEEAKRSLFRTRIKALETTEAKMQAELTPKRAAANQEIEAVIDPLRKGRWLTRLEYAANYVKIRGATIFLSLLIIAFAYKGVQLSSENLPAVAHFIVLGIYFLGLAYLVFVIGTEKNRIKYRQTVNIWFGPRGMLVLPFILLGTAGSVLASITFRLYSHGWLSLETCSGRPVTEAGLMDFYMWHFFNIIPVLQLNNLIRWGEPYCYKQCRVGFLILAFQLLVVIPSFNTIRFYWKRRHTPSEYIYDPFWTPEDAQTEVDKLQVPSKMPS